MAKLRGKNSSEPRSENTDWLVEQGCDIVDMYGVSHRLRPGFVMFAFGTSHDDPVQLVFGDAGVFMSCVVVREAAGGAVTLPNSIVAAKVFHLDLWCLEMRGALMLFNNL